MKRFLKILLRTFIVLFVLVNIITAFHAYKFTHFYDNGSITIKKGTDKSGWDKTKEALFGINAVKQLNDTVDATYQVIYLTTKSNLKLQGWYVPVLNAKGTVALFHGHGGTKSGVIKEGEEFRKMGYNTLLMDFRAHGNSEGNTCTIGFKEAEDVKLAYDFIKNKGEKNIVLWGISMGGATVAKAIGDYELKPNKVILEMPFGSIVDAAEGRIRMMKLPAEPLATLITFWGSVENGFWAFNMKPINYVKKITCPVLLQWGKNDPRVSQEETDAIFENIPTQKKLVVYDSCGHESLCKKETAKWVTAISAFLQ
jgi:alpha-beta hydrolase superfamily lysophospholipase